MIYMLIGVVLRKTGVVDERIMRGANNIVYYVTLPLMCYRAIAAADIETMFDTPFLLYMAIGIVGEAQTAAAVLGHNFPDSRWYKDAYNLVKSGGVEPAANKDSWMTRAFKKVGLG